MRSLAFDPDSPESKPQFAFEKLPIWLKPVFSKTDPNSIVLVGTPSGMGVTTVIIRVTDQHGAFALQSFQITVVPANQPPVANAGGGYVAQEAAPLVLDASGSFDPDLSDVLTFEWDLDYDGLSFDVEATGVQPSIAFADNFAARTIAVRVTDNLGAATIDTATLEITNVSPTIAISGGANVDEGTPYILSLGAVSDPGQDTVGQYIVDWGDGVVVPYSVDGNQQHVYRDDGPQSDKTITVSLVDEDGTHQNVATKTLTVRNVRPSDITVSNATLTGSSSNAVFAATVHFVDPGDADVWTAEIDYGDGQIEVKAAASDRNLALNHDYTALGDLYRPNYQLANNQRACINRTFSIKPIVNGGPRAMDPIAA